MHITRVLKKIFQSIKYFLLFPLTVLKKIRPQLGCIVQRRDKLNPLVNQKLEQRLLFWGKDYKMLFKVSYEKTC